MDYLCYVSKQLVFCVILEKYSYNPKRIVRLSFITSNRQANGWDVPDNKHYIQGITVYEPHDVLSLVIAHCISPVLSCV